MQAYARMRACVSEACLSRMPTHRKCPRELPCSSRTKNFDFAIAVLRTRGAAANVPEHHDYTPKHVSCSTHSVTTSKCAASSSACAIVAVSLSRRDTKLRTSYRLTMPNCQAKLGYIICRYEVLNFVNGPGGAKKLRKRPHF